MFAASSPRGGTMEIRLVVRDGCVPEGDHVVEGHDTPGEEATLVVTELLVTPLVLGALAPGLGCERAVEGPVLRCGLLLPLSAFEGETRVE